MRLSWRSLAVVGVLSSLCNSVLAHSQSRPPLAYLSIIEDPVIDTPSHRVHSHSQFDLTFNLHKKKQRIRLSLEPNHDILDDNSHVQYLDPDGNVIREEPIVRQDHKVYKGSSWLQEKDGKWSNVGWARITVRRDGVVPLFEGAFSISHNAHHVQLRSNYMETKHAFDPHAEHSDDEYMVIFRDSDFGRDHLDLRKRDASRSCTSDDLNFNVNPQHPIRTKMLKRDMGSWGTISLSSLFSKRQIDSNGFPNSGGNSGGVNLRDSIGSTVGCPSTRKVALIGVATDCSYTGSFNSSDTARLNIINSINSASDVYERTFNITLGLQNLTISDANCPGSPPSTAPWNIPCGGNTTITDRLNLFSAWRGQRQDNNAYWTLLTRCSTGAEVGLAWLGQLCVNTAQTSQGETTSGANVVARTSTEWQVIAHESGHTFGAVHDCDRDTCAAANTVSAQQCCPRSQNSCDANAQFIMNPSTADGITNFSPCTVGNICSALRVNSVKSTCLTDNKGVTTISGNQCGNGIVEDGEDCDCGGEGSCQGNNCCDAKTCKFKNSAVCDDSNEDCCRGCQFASNGTVCRGSTGVCDPQETCDGGSPTCPTDKTQPDGSDCGSGLQCASGQCTSRDLQCKTLMGAYVTNNDTYACNTDDCMISCQSPQFGQNTCYGLQQFFLDGTPCGGGGKCGNGVCKDSSLGQRILQWINDNKPIVIGVSCALGVLLLACVFSCCCRRRKRSKYVKQPQRAGTFPNGMPVNQMQQQWPGTHHGWNNQWQPQPMSPAHHGSPVHGGPGQVPPVPAHLQNFGYGGNSVRYA